MSMLQFDDDAARHIRRVYSTPDVVQQRAEVIALLAAQPGERVLDVGSGPGFLVASLADAVGPGGAVRGLDQSAPMNAAARDLIKERPWAGIDDGDALTLRTPTPPSTPSCRPRSTSTSRTSPEPSRNCAASCGRADGPSSWTPTGTRWCGTSPIGSAIDR
jgi:SAM-dependent methyltransferase